MLVQRTKRLPETDSLYVCTYLYPIKLILIIFLSNIITIAFCLFLSLYIEKNIVICVCAHHFRKIIPL